VSKKVSRDLARRSWPVLHHNGPSEILRELRRQRTCDEVRRSARRDGDEYFDRRSCRDLRLGEQGCRCRDGGGTYET
jgi:hypothetical protein